MMLDLRACVLLVRALTTAPDMGAQWMPWLNVATSLYMPLTNDMDKPQPKGFGMALQYLCCYMRGVVPGVNRMFRSVREFTFVQVSPDLGQQLVEGTTRTVMGDIMQMMCTALSNLTNLVLMNLTVGPETTGFAEDVQRVLMEVR